MIYGLDLFSGIGGLSVALSDWVRPVAYCENDRYAQSVLLSRMLDRTIARAPIWDDVRTLLSRHLPEIDIIYGGFPCQDISVAGNGKGLAGERSGLFFEVVRLIKDIKPTFVFLENVPAIRTRGLDAVIKEITDAGYDCRWTDLSAAEVGAPHKRNRWWLLGYSKHNGQLATEKRGSSKETISNNEKGQNETSKFKGAGTSAVLPESFIPDSRREYQGTGENLRSDSQEPIRENFTKLREAVPNASSKRLEGQRQEPSRAKQELGNASLDSWWAIEPDVGRVVNGLPHRVDRIKCLGNAVVPLCAKEAFKELMGIK